MLFNMADKSFPENPAHLPRYFMYLIFLQPRNNNVLVIFNPCIMLLEYKFLFIFSPAFGLLHFYCHLIISLKMGLKMVSSVNYIWKNNKGLIIPRNGKIEE